MPSINASWLNSYKTNDITFIFTVYIIATYITFIILTIYQPKHILSFIVFSVITNIVISIHYFLYPLVEEVNKLVSKVGAKIDCSKVRGYYNPSKQENYLVVDDSPHKLSSKNGWGAVPETPWELEQT